VDNVEFDGHISPDGVDNNNNNNNNAAKAKGKRGPVSHNDRQSEFQRSPRREKEQYPVGQSDVISGEGYGRSGTLERHKVTPAGKGTSDHCMAASYELGEQESHGCAAYGIPAQSGKGSPVDVFNTFNSLTVNIQRNPNYQPGVNSPWQIGEGSAKDTAVTLASMFPGERVAALTGRAAK
jgi:hypothetical protein